MQCFIGFYIIATIRKKPDWWIPIINGVLIANQIISDKEKGCDALQVGCLDRVFTLFRCANHRLLELREFRAIQCVNKIQKWIMADIAEIHWFLWIKWNVALISAIEGNASIATEEDYKIIWRGNRRKENGIGNKHKESIKW